MHLGIEKLRDRIQMTMEEAIANCTKCSDELKGVMKEWIENRGSSSKSAEVTARLIPLMEACGCDYCKKILEHKDWLIKNRSGSSVATAGATTSVTAVWTTCWLRVRT